jgi:hypothetical protein
MGFLRALEHQDATRVKKRGYTLKQSKAKWPEGCHQQVRARALSKRRCDDSGRVAPRMSELVDGTQTVSLLICLRTA